MQNCAIWGQHSKAWAIKPAPNYSNSTPPGATPPGIFNPTTNRNESKSQRFWHQFSAFLGRISDNQDPANFNQSIMVTDKFTDN